jgi:carboxymethylenebutenolidase
MADFAEMFDAHTKAEFEDVDLEATMETMSGDPQVHHVPTITGGDGAEGVRDFYERHFIGQWPHDTETRLVSRTVGESQLVDELMLTFTHDREIEILLPGISPTGRRISVPTVVIVGFEDGRVSSEHIYWDQATVLVQAGLLDPGTLPVTGSAQSDALLDRTIPKNELLSGD